VAAMSGNAQNYTYIVPTLNAAAMLPHLLPLLPKEATLFIDSSSCDGTRSILESNGFKCITISRSEFNHGATRNLCLRFCNSEFVIFLTQDAWPVDACLAEQLLKPFSDPSVAATYARQLPKRNADVLEALDRTYKYPAESILQHAGTEAELGSRIYFLSNSCAAYRLSVFRQLGGFPESEIMGEDAIFARKLIGEGYKILYVPQALVLHSHAYTWLQLFKRYFDTGVYRVRMTERSLAARDTSQGKAYVAYIFASLIRRRQYSLILVFLLNTVVSFLGYSLGRRYYLLPNSLRRRLSMHSFYWSRFSSDYCSKVLLESWKNQFLSKILTPLSICVGLLIAYFTRTLWSNQLASFENYTVYLFLWLCTYFIIANLFRDYLQERNGMAFYATVAAFLVSVFVLFISRLFPVSRFVIVMSILISGILIYSIKRTLDFVAQSVQEL
jgi:rhamnosyltransferase